MSNLFFLLAAAPTGAQSLDKAAKPIPARCAQAVQPKDALKPGDWGVVTIRVRVDAAGNADPIIVKSSGIRDLDKAAFVALRACQHEPAIVNGEPSASVYVMQYLFTSPTHIPITSFFNVRPADAESTFAQPRSLGCPKLGDVPLLKAGEPRERSSINPTETYRVRVGGIVNVEGAVIDARIVRKSGVDTLDQMGLDHIKACRFRPGTISGQAVAAPMEAEAVWFPVATIP